MEANTTINTGAKALKQFFPVVITIVFVALTVASAVFLAREDNKDESYYSSTHITQTRIKSDNLVNSSTAQIVFGLDAVAFLEPMPTQRAVLGSDERNTFFENCIYNSFGASTKSAEECAKEGTVPYLVINGITGQSFYLTGAHNSRLLLLYLTWYIAGALAMVSAFIYMNMNLFNPDAGDTLSSEILVKKLQKFTTRVLIFCVAYVVMPIMVAYLYNDNEPRNGASTFYGLLSIFSVVFSFLWSFVSEKRRIMFLISEFPKIKLNSNGESSAGKSSESEELLSSGDIGQSQIMIPKSMTVTGVKSSSVQMKAIYDTEAESEKYKKFDVATFKTIRFTPTNTFILKSMVPLFFLWAVVVKTRQKVGLDVDLQLYTIGLTVFAFNNYMFKKSFAFVSYTYAWIHSKSSETPVMNVIGTYFQIILSSMLIQFLIIITLLLYDTPFRWSSVVGPIYVPMFFIFICDVFSVFYFALPSYSDKDTDSYKKFTGIFRNDRLQNFWKWFFDRDILYVSDDMSGATHKTLYLPLGAAQFYGVCVIFLIHIIVLWAA